MTLDHRVDEWQRGANPDCSNNKTLDAPRRRPPLQEMGGIQLGQEEGGSSVPAGALPPSIGPPRSLDSWLPSSLRQGQKEPHSFLLRSVKLSSNKPGPGRTERLRNHPGTHSTAQDPDLPPTSASHTRVGIDRPSAKSSLFRTGLNTPPSHLSPKL